MTCRRFVDLIIDHEEGTLPKASLLGFLFHKLVCRMCRDYLASYRKTIELARSAYRDPD